MLTHLARLTLRLATRPLDQRGQHPLPDAIVVLGAPVWPDGTLPPAVRERVEMGVDLLRTTAADCLVLTGGSVRGPAEAPAMAAHAEALGVPASSLILESESRTTRQNAQYCAKLLLPDRPSVILVSQPFHLRRACGDFDAAGFRAVGAAAPDSVYFRDPLRGWRWVVREYVATAWHLAKRPKSR